MTMQLQDIKKLAEMARIDMSEKEMEGIAHDFDSILAYVGQIKEVAINLPKDEDEKLDKNSSLKNVMREDVATNTPGFFADKIIEEMPEKEGRYLKVRQIL